MSHDDDGRTCSLHLEYNGLEAADEVEVALASGVAISELIKATFLGLEWIDMINLFVCHSITDTDIDLI
jgi:hypothetical protein